MTELNSVDRIMMLAEEADVIVHNDFGKPMNMDALIDFAKLIAKDCAWTCDTLLNNNISSEWSRGTHDCACQIRKIYEAHYD
jgi:hypothetical protein